MTSDANKSLNEISVSCICDKEKDLAVSSASSLVVSWKNVNVLTKSRKKRLLKDARGQISGGLWAIMGSSGSGKTTLMSTLALRLDSNMVMLGELRINGRAYSRRDLKNLSGYVMQDDLLDGNFTVLETLSYAAQLRMSATANSKDRGEKIRQVMDWLDIKHVQNVLVGDTQTKGISGGERKRLCIAIELLCDPKLLFLDEPTSGLDAYTALSVITRLKKLTLHNKNSTYGACTVVSTLHQPSTQVFSLFDHILLMSRGRIVFQGPANMILKYFENLGFPCPIQMNPADHFIFVLATDPAFQRAQHLSPLEDDKDNLIDEDTGEDNTDAKATNLASSLAFLSLSQTDDSENIDIVREESNEEIEKGTKVFRAEENVYPVAVDMSCGSETADYYFTSTITRSSWLKQFLVLLHRAVLSHVRRWDVILLNIAVTLLVAGFVCGSVWNDIGTSKASASRRQPALFFCVIHQGIVASFQGTHSFPLERALMLRERSSGMYSVSAYFLSKTIADMLVLQIISPIVFTCVVYPVIGFAMTAEQFFIFMGLMMLTSMAATSLANMAACVCVTVSKATVFLAATYEISRLYGAWFISPKLLSEYSDWTFADTLSYTKYSFVAVSLNENAHLELHCTDDELSKVVSVVNGNSVTSYSCVIPPLNKAPYTGAAFNAYYGYDQFTVGGCVGALVLYIFGCRLLAYLALRFIKH